MAKMKKTGKMSTSNLKSVKFEYVIINGVRYNFD